MKKTTFSTMAAIALATIIFTSHAEASSITYTVKPSDTLWKVATQHNMTVNQLKELNDITSDIIKIDQKLTIKTGQDVTKNTTPNIVSKQEYSTIVQAGKKIRVPVVVEAVAPPEIVISSDPVPTASAKSILRAAVDISLPLQGTPYLWAGSSTEGFDCSGFISYVYKTAGLNLSRTDTIGLFSLTSYVNEPLQGDLVFFENTYRSGISHIGIYLGNGNFIHAGSTQVEIASINSVYWKDKFHSFKRFNKL